MQECAKQECNAQGHVICVNVRGRDKSPCQGGVPGLVDAANCSREEAGLVA